MHAVEPGRIKFRVLSLNDKSISNTVWDTTVKKKLTDMKTKDLLTIAAVSAGLAFGVTTQAKGREHEEQTINTSDVPAAVQQAAQAEAKGGTIVRWEKEGANFEAVIEKNGKQIGVEMDASGKLLNKHNKAKEPKEKGAKY